jgi:hypothetical protein
LRFDPRRKGLVVLVPVEGIGGARPAAAHAVHVPQDAPLNRAGRQGVTYIEPTSATRCSVAALQLHPFGVRPARMPSLARTGASTCPVGEDAFISPALCCAFYACLCASNARRDQSRSRAGRRLRKSGHSVCDGGGHGQLTTSRDALFSASAVPK